MCGKTTVSSSEIRRYVGMVPETASDPRDVNSSRQGPRLASLALGLALRINDGRAAAASPPGRHRDRSGRRQRRARRAVGRGPRGLGAGSPAAPHRAVVELRRPGSRAASHGDAAVARYPGGGGRHRVPLPGDLPLHRRAHRPAQPEPEGVSLRARPGLARGALGKALGAGARGDRALQPAQQDRAHAAGPRRARRARLDRRAAPLAVELTPASRTCSGSRTAT